MNIFFDMRVLDNKNITGVGKYALNLFNEVSKLDEFKFFSMGNNNYINNYEKIEGELPISDIDLANKIITFKGYANNIDLFHSPYYPIPIKRKFKGVITIHDLIALKHPEWFNSMNTYNFYDIHMRESLKNINHVIAVSKSTKKDIINYYNVDPDKITVIYPGVVSNIRKNNDMEKDHEILKKYKIDKPYILSVCTLEPRKNLIRVVQAYDNFCKANKEDIQLVLVGMNGWNYKEIIDSVVKSQYSKNIILTNYVNDNEISALYKNALVFVYASLYEGFGSPVLEAMEFGTPVITSNISSLPEVGGNSVLYCDPYDISSIENVMTQLCFSPLLREELKLKSIKQKDKFSYKMAAEQTREVYKKCLEEM